MRTVLVVDDEDIVREGLKTQIPWAKYGFRVIDDCASGLIAEDIIRQKLPDLLMTDIKMPDISGLELIKRAKRIKPDLQCIILSAYDTFAFAQQALLYDVVGYLLKPVDLHELEILMEKVNHSFLTAPKTPPPAPDPIEQIRAYVQTHYSEKITLDQLSSLFFLTPSYISSMFKSKTGIALVDYITEIRIREAKKLLLNSEHRVRDIALEVGYEDYTYFCKVFRKLVGKTPLEFRFDHK